jgi:HK97 family phage prohead protease
MTTMKIEYRSFGVSAVMADDNNITGLAAPFNSQTMIGEEPWGFREQIAPGAFSKTLQEADVVFLLNHDTSKPLARKSAGTLTLRESERGLEIEAKTADTSYANDLRTNIKAGNVRGMSFGFEVIKERWTDDEGNEADKWTGTQRLLQEVKLIETSAVTFPAYGATDISARDAVSAARDERAKSKGNSKPYGDVVYADPKNGKYPLNTKKRVKAAWSYINMPKNAAEYPLNGVSLASVKSKIRAAAAKFGIKISQKNEEALALEWRRFTDEPPQVTAADLSAAIARFTKAAKRAQVAFEALAGATSTETPGEPGEEPTPEPTSTDDALRASFAKAQSRGFDLGY